MSDPVPAHPPQQTKDLRPRITSTGLSRFVWASGDIRITRRRRGNAHHVDAEDTTPWVQQEPHPEPERIDPLVMGQCWREGCYRWVPLEDDLGLCPQCIAHLRTL